MQPPTDTVVIYHARCRDGFSAAYAAWKKFGDTATYIPRKNQEEPPQDLDGKKIYILDYSYDKVTLDALKERVQSLVVIDHHQTAEKAVAAFPENIFDQSHSGAVLAWQYFHPHEPLPRLFAYIEDADLWKHALPHGKEIGAVIAEYDFSFSDWELLRQDMEDGATFKKLIERGSILSDAKERHIHELVQYAEKVELEGHKVLAVNCARPYRSDVGNLLAETHPPFGIVWYHYEGSFHVSLRSTGDFSVAKLAEKYGGGGHKNAASMLFENYEDIPFRFL